jgi:glycosyltransferase involved in cell wall biosynthesis
MHILHICSDFSNQRIYNQLITHLSELKIEQTVYVPTRTKEEVGKYRNHDLQSVNYRYSNILKPFHRFIFHLKINTIYEDLIKSTDVANVNKTHAHFLFSDGAVALKLKRSHDIPYIVAVRNTDINIFFRYMRHLRSRGLEILKEAEQIIFITPSYQSLLLNTYIPFKYREELKSKMTIIPNGIESFWISNVPEKTINNSSTLKLLYVGDFSHNKNVPALLNCVKKLNAQNIESTLTLVGGGGSQENEVVKMLASPDYEMVKFIGRINDLKSLLEIYKSHHIFIMVSFKETFGVVYLEAMSQGLPIIYTKGQGIDGYFEDGLVGYSVNPKDNFEIISKIIKIKTKIGKMKIEAIKESHKFNWKDISQRYYNIYLEK